MVVRCQILRLSSHCFAFTLSNIRHFTPLRMTKCAAKYKSWRCYELVCQSLVTSHLRLLIPSYSSLLSNFLWQPFPVLSSRAQPRDLSRETLIQSLSDFTLESLCIARNNLTRIASYLRKGMTKLCIKILVKSDSVIESAFPLHCGQYPISTGRETMPCCYMFLCSRRRRLSVCKEDFSLTLEMTMRGSDVSKSPSLSVSALVTSHQALKPPNP